jgi:hypothetical protein
MHPGGSQGECLHIHIQQDVAGAFHATIRSDPNMFNPVLQGPFAPATDPNVGYPTTLNPNQYYSAENFCTDVDYRLFDPLFANGTFSFWFSPLDLWSDWCALQTPFVWNVRGQTKYGCVPQTADSSTTDFGKLVLCRDAQDGPLCTDSTGVQGPCVCLNDAGVIVASVLRPLCSSSVCECTASQCRALLRTTALSATLTLSGDELAGPFPPPGAGNSGYVRVTFRRAHP